jgi:hypothetical protein
MGGAMSKDKGDRFERDLRKRLSKWWGCPWERTTLHHGASKKDLPGDLMAINPRIRFPFVIEAKHQEGWGFEQFLANPDTSVLGLALAQAAMQAEGQGRGDPWLLLIKRNRGKVWAIYSTGILRGARPPVLALLPWRGSWVVVACLDDLEQISPADLVASLTDVPPDER